ncbi:interferon-induced protein 44-like [Colossoma macropomum]|uniref:interferon-induced protein 44-like n=1 Tax=Colossoma macropomum TaxID=42526 RepID=UPI001863AB5D|nr:interferon-induced protein 44-like [Colossoma macropomum]XP_036418094.1 interferon-induced protein 44-like [Colossoma macropomum]XP_036418095.1 interferon-induced protein 44-like [Colossoma macropomum]XP_036418096.1 interferon-induced protein 44-like [Colossoma macropomum]
MGGTSSKSTPTTPPTPRPTPPTPHHTPGPSPELINPWRPVNWGEKEKILKDLKDLKPQLEPLRILLYGPVGAGKSCFINSVQRTLIGRNFISALESTTESGESFTTKIKTHKMKKHGGGYYPVVFTDIMGLEMNKGGIHTEDIIKILEGHILDNYKFNPRGPITENDRNYNPCPNPCDKVHCVVSIVPADGITRMDQSVINKMKEVREKASELNIPQVIVLTKVDKACEIVHRDLRKLYHSRKIKEKTQHSSNNLGIPVNSIYPVKNYHEEVTEDNDIDVIILMALRDIFNFANDYAEATYEPSDN